MKTRGVKVVLLIAGLLGVAGIASLQAQAKRAEAASRTAGELPSSDRVVHFIRERFGIPDSVSLTPGTYRPSPDPGYDEMTIAVDEGTDKPNAKHTNEVTVSKNGRYLILGSFIRLTGAKPETEVAQQVRQAFKIPPSFDVSVSPLRNSPYLGFYQTTITVSQGAQKQSQNYYVTKDRRFLALGGIFDLTVDPVSHAERVIRLANQPSVGPSNAHVTIVEYADLECPSCAALHAFLENQFLPKYSDRVKVVFKEFPLVGVHEWALTAAIASQCVYQINPKQFLPFRTLVFLHQPDVDAVQANASAVRDLLLSYGQQAGVDRLQLAACVDSKASLPRVEENLNEGKELGITQTPTLFINGKIMIGATPDVLFRTVDEALGTASR